MTKSGSDSSGFVRLIIAILSLVLGIITIVILHLTLSNEMGKILLDSRNGVFNPFAVQNIMWMVFFLGLGELVVRFLTAHRESAQLSRNILPEDDQTILVRRDLGPIYMKANAGAARDRFLPRLIRRIILNFQSTQSVNQANSLLNSSLELFIHEIDLRYNMLRYIMWFIPTLGFIGTVIGISGALEKVGKGGVENLDLGGVVGELGVAFYTTLVALLMSAVIVFLLHLIQGEEETALNRAGQYCLDNLINRLHTS